MSHLKRYIWESTDRKQQAISQICLVIQQQQKQIETLNQQVADARRTIMLMYEHFYGPNGLAVAFKAADFDRAMKILCDNRSLPQAMQQMSLDDDEH